MFRTTLVNLAPDAAVTKPEAGPSYLGELSHETMGKLLETFRTLDEAEVAKAEPEIIIETRRQKHIVRTSQGRLHLYDARDPLAPAHTLNVSQLLAEIDGSAHAARSLPPFQYADKTPPLPAVAAKTTRAAAGLLRPWQRIALGAVSLGLAVYVGSALLASRAISTDDGFEAVTDTRAGEGFRNQVAGVYMTGQQPGDHGIALTADGHLKLFQLNAQGTPSLLRDTYRIGHLGGQLAALGTETKVILRFKDPGQLTNGGEKYRRIE